MPANPCTNTLAPSAADAARRAEALGSWGTFSRSTACLALLAGYLLGSIPFGLILTKAAGLGDVRSIGSGNIGATNVLRTGNKGLAAATLVLDTLKGTLAVLIVYDMALRFGGSDAFAHRQIADALQYSYIAGLGAFLGHIYPVWLRFQGGKGVATFIGVLIGMHWPAALWFGIIWIGVALTHALLVARRACAPRPASCFTISSPAGRGCRSCSSWPR